MIGLCVFKVRKTSWEAHLEHLSHVQWVEATKMRRLAAVVLPAPPDDVNCGVKLAVIARRYRSGRQARGGVLVQRVLVTADLPSWDLQLRSDPLFSNFPGTLLELGVVPSTAKTHGASASSGL